MMIWRKVLVIENQDLQSMAWSLIAFHSVDMAKNVTKAHKIWEDTPGKKGQKHGVSNVRTVHLPPKKSLSGWSIEKYRGRWDLITDHLDDKPNPQGDAPATD